MRKSWPGAEAWLERLVGFATVAGTPNLMLVEHVRDRLDALGVPVTIGHDPTGTRADLLFTIGPQDRPGILLSAHSDVVPVAGQAWTTDPFRLERQGERLVGRGACDMKGFIACVLASVPAMLEAGLRTPIHLGVSYDEELGCKGAPALVRRIAAELRHRPLGCIVGEPSMMRLVDAHKGKGGWRCTLKGRPGHSALTDRGVNAVAVAARLIVEITAMHERFVADGPFMAGFDPPHGTASIGRIEGGGQLNIIPEQCFFDFEFRTLPGETPDRHLAAVRRFAEERLLPPLRAIAPEAQVEFAELIAYPGLAPAPASPFRSMVEALAEPGPAGKVAYGTDGGIIAQTGIPTLICGPGDMDVAHKADEYVTRRQLHRCMDFLAGLTARCAETLPAWAALP